MQEGIGVIDINPDGIHGIITYTINLMVIMNHDVITILGKSKCLIPCKL